MSVAKPSVWAKLARNRLFRTASVTGTAAATAIAVTSGESHAFPVVFNELLAGLTYVWHVLKR
jgi:hypothetical protein